MPRQSLDSVNRVSPGENGYAMLFVLLMVGVIGFIMINFQMGKIRNTRYETYFALGQDIAMLSRAAHTYVQDVAYLDPYLYDPLNINDVGRVNFYQTHANGLIAGLREPLGSPANQPYSQFTLTELQNVLPGSGNGYVDTGFNFNNAIRGVHYTVFGYGGAVPLHAPKELQAASALLVLNGRAVAPGSDMRTAADMAALRAGAAAAGLTRIGVVVPPGRRKNSTGGDLMCNNQAAVVVWGNSASDCLNATDVGAIGMVLDNNDIVVPTWESVEKQLDKNAVYSRPHPGFENTNILYANLRMDGNNGYSAVHDITDANEIFSNTVNIANITNAKATELHIGDTKAGAPDGDAKLIVGRANNANPQFTGPNVCNTTLPADHPLDTTKATPAPVGACITQAITIDKNMNVAFAKETDTNPAHVNSTRLYAPLDMMKVDGSVEVAQGNLNINADGILNPITNKPRGYFDVTNGTGSGNAKFNINNQANGGNGTVINKNVAVQKFTVANPSPTENFVVEDQLSIINSPTRIGRNTQPVEVILSNAPLTDVKGNLAIDTSGKGNNNGVYGANTAIDSLTQTDPAQPIVIKHANFPDAVSGTPVRVNVGGNSVINAGGQHADSNCVGSACPNHISINPPKREPF